MRFACEEFDTATVVTIEEERLDASVASGFKDFMRGVIAGGAPIYLLDLGPVRFMDSSGMGAIVGVMKMLGRERRLELCTLTPPVKKVFSLTKMDLVLTIHDTVDAALSHHRVEPNRMRG